MIWARGLRARGGRWPSPARAPLRASQHFAGADAHVDRARLGDLRDPGTDRSWMWSAQARDADRGEFTEAMRIRLGASGPPEPTLRGVCGERLLDAAGARASTCCIWEATVGHGLAMEELHRFAVMGDPRRELEPENFVRSRPLGRPADVPTAAVGSLSALDVGVTSSATAPAPGEGAAEAMWQRKTRGRDSVRGELEELGIVYTPVVWTSHGRPRPQAAAAVPAIARAAARRRGGAARAMERALRGRIGAALALRGARVSLAPMAPLDDGAAEPGAGVWRVLAAVDAAAAADAQGSAGQRLK
ncbi:unnamed protein product [Prorocentrum cordatum]|uniref:Uncharacterized protein n=1 Tax=Prorocentrum cordatum TaxID=2364126 RepID=A0ABN9XUQ2_9DINO|nr:unnamed protein product [Polarella glacialis]